MVFTIYTYIVQGVQKCSNFHLMDRQFVLVTKGSLPLRGGEVRLYFFGGFP